jgi:hypothetical protein
VLNSVKRKLMEVAWKGYCHQRWQLPPIATGLASSF